MKVRIWATEKPGKLVENLEKQVKSVEEKDDHIQAEVEDTDVLERTPGVEKFEKEGDELKGLGGSPVDQQAYARIDSREDAVKALLATIQGYDLRILETGREWDLRQLKKYNPDIKHLKFSEPKDFLEIDKVLFNSDGKEEIEIEMPDDEETLLIYREMLT